MTTLLVKGKGLVSGISVIPDADTPWPDYNGQYFLIGDEKYYNEDVYILPSNRQERETRLKLLRTNADIRSGQLGDLEYDEAILSFLNSDAR